MGGPADRRSPTTGARPTRPRIALADRAADAALPARDRGPVRARVRDLVDGRRHPLLVPFMPAFAMALITLAYPASAFRNALLLGSLAVLAVVAAAALVLGRSVTRTVRAEHPDVPVSGLRTGWYAFMRAHRPQSMRTPRPRVPAGRG